MGRNQETAQRWEGTLYITADELIGRGWTRYQIDKYIGDPDQIKRSGWSWRYLWRRERTDQLSPKPPRAVHPARAVDLLAAIFAVNRSAKRYRDAAESCYHRDAHNCARIARNKKGKLYGLKDRGIAAAYRAGRLSYSGMHARLSVYRRDGYTFHSTLVPVDAPATEAQTDAPFLRVEVKPKTTREARLTDAEYTLSQLQLDYSGFRVLDSPQLSARPKHYVAVCDDEDDEEEWEGED